MKNKKEEAEYYKNKHTLEIMGITDKEFEDGDWKKEPVFKVMPKEHIKRFIEERRVEDDICCNTLMFDMITKDEFDKKIVGEYNVRRSIFLCAAGGRLVINSQIASYNLLINDEAGTGKDYVTGNVLSIMSKDIYIKKTRISPAVFTYWHNAQYEPEWTWNGKIFYTEDISEAVLNSEVFKVMCSSGSEATVVIKQRAIDIPINGKPVMIVTTANSVPSPELTRRFEIVNLDEGHNQTSEIMKRHAEYAVSGKSPEYDPSIGKSLEALERVRVKIPFAKHLATIFPPESIMMRTKFPRFIDFIKASAALHQKQRKKDKDKYILAERLDYEIACEIMNGMATNKYMISLTKNQKRIFDFITMMCETNKDYLASASEIRNQMNDFLSLKGMLTNLSHLTSYGLLKTELVITENLNREIEKYKIGIINKDLNKGILFPSFEVFNDK